MRKRNNRKAGIRYEQEVIRQLKDLGFTCASSRAESRNKDKQGVDVVSEDLPVYIQLKNSCSSINYHAVFEKFKLKDKPLVIIHKKTKKVNVNFICQGEYVIMTKDLFYSLLKNSSHESRN